MKKCNSFQLHKLIKEANNKFNYRIKNKILKKELNQLKKTNKELVDLTEFSQ